MGVCNDVVVLDVAITLVVDGIAVDCRVDVKASEELEEEKKGDEVSSNSSLLDAPAEEVLLVAPAAENAAKLVVKDERGEGELLLGAEGRADVVAAEEEGVVGGPGVPVVAQMSASAPVIPRGRKPVRPDRVSTDCGCSSMFAASVKVRVFDAPASGLDCFASAVVKRGMTIWRGFKPFATPYSSELGKLILCASS